MAAALDAAHERGLVHRDVKPGNILLSGEGEHEHVYLTDFGLTKRLGSAGSLTRPGAWVGTPDYVAPEQIQAGNVDGRADVYSLGCVLYEMLTGDVAFPKDNDMAKLWAHVTDAPPSPGLRRPDLVPAFNDVVARATAKEPDARYARASDLAAAVDEAIREQSSRVVPGGLQDTRAAAGSGGARRVHRRAVPVPRSLPARPRAPGGNITAGFGVRSASGSPDHSSAGYRRGSRLGENGCVSRSRGPSGPGGRGWRGRPAEPGMAKSASADSSRGRCRCSRRSRLAARGWGRG